jgi:uncharacterized protein
MIGEIDNKFDCILWRRLDAAGHESFRMYGDDDGWYLDGAAIFMHEGLPARLDYLVECTTDWITSYIHVDGWVGDEIIEIEIEANERSVWRLNGEEIKIVEGCQDIDLNFSPATNMLPMRRLDLKVSERKKVRAAWLKFPSFELEPLDQTYTRINATTVKYESSTGFTADLTINEEAIVTEYPGLWTTEK